MTAEEILVRLRELKPQVFQKFRAKEIQLFGSNVRREQNAESDIDILVDFEDEADLFDLTGLAIFLEDELQQKVDVVPKRALRKELQESILNEAIAV
ncbi:MAG: nucleotidyltransferase family protein [Deltaproteobacteria bacterium]|nr:nucleotidyltransferase family protein [Deltaproteobacteria bacterium]